MDYPQDFPAESRAKVEAAIIRAGRQFDSKRVKAKWSSDTEALFWTYVLTPFLVFAGESARLGLWPADKMDRNCQEFLCLLTRDAHYNKGRAAGVRDMTSHLDGSILWEAEQKIQKTSQWRKYENIRLQLPVKGRPTTQGTAQNSDKTAQSVKGKSTNAAAGSIPTPSKKRDPEVAKRRALVKSNEGVPVLELCGTFDRQNVPLPAAWQAAGLKKWVEAHRKHPNRVKVIVSKDRTSD
jgi:hypothetical protein